jgi:hypothetical protein
MPDLEELEELVRQRRLLDEAIEDVVVVLRVDHSWAEIGRAMGRHESTVAERYGPIFARRGLSRQ